VFIYNLLPHIITKKHDGVCGVHVDYVFLYVWVCVCVRVRVRVHAHVRFLQLRCVKTQIVHFDLQRELMHIRGVIYQYLYCLQLNICSQEKTGQTYNVQNGGESWTRV
jgi:hypothetical protein